MIFPQMHRINGYITGREVIFQTTRGLAGCQDIHKQVDIRKCRDTTCSETPALEPVTINKTSEEGSNCLLFNKHNCN